MVHVDHRAIGRARKNRQWIEVLVHPVDDRDRRALALELHFPPDGPVAYCTGPIPVSRDAILIVMDAAGATPTEGEESIWWVRDCVERSCHAPDSIVVEPPGRWYGPLLSKRLDDTDHLIAYAKEGAGLATAETEWPNLIRRWLGEIAGPPAVSYAISGVRGDAENAEALMSLGMIPPRGGAWRADYLRLTSSSIRGANVVRLARSLRLHLIADGSPEGHERLIRVLCDDLTDAAYGHVCCRRPFRHASLFNVNRYILDEAILDFDPDVLVSGMWPAQLLGPKHIERLPPATREHIEPTASPDRWLLRLGDLDYWHGDDQPAVETRRLANQLGDLIATDYESATAILRTYGLSAVRKARQEVAE